MVEQARKPPDRAVADDPLMHKVVCKSRLFTTKKTQHVIRKPARVAHGAAQEGGESRNLVSVRKRGTYCGQYFGSERRRNALVGVDRQHPFAPRLRQCKVLLGAETGPRMGHDRSAGGPGDLDGVVIAAAVDHDALIAERDAFAARPDV